jgi:SIR2-like domain
VSVYGKLIESLVRINKSYTLATTNYDLLIEDMISMYGYEPIYDFDLQPRHDKSMQVLKIHGSCNFWPKMTNITFRNYKSRSRHLFEGPIDIVDRKGIVDRCAREDSVPPAIAMYMEDKPVKSCPKFVTHQLEMWQHQAVIAETNFVGLDINERDRHIWATPAESRGDLLYVGSEDKFNDWKKSISKENAWFIGGKFHEALEEI